MLTKAKEHFAREKFHTGTALYFENVYFLTFKTAQFIGEKFHTGTALYFENG